MEKMFVPYELALELKELGFKEECFGCYYQAIEHVARDYYKREDKVYNEGSPIYFTTGHYYKTEKYSKFLVGVPTWEQAFNFLLKKCNLDDSKYSLEYTENGWLLSSFNEVCQDFDVLLNEDALKKLIELSQK